MRIVFAWSTIIPLLVFGAVDTIFTLLLGRDNLLVLLVNNIGVIWGTVIGIASIRELTNLSIWRSGVVWLSPYLIIMGRILGLGLPIWLKIL